MIIKLLLLLIFFLAIFRYLISQRQITDLKFYMFSSVVQSLMVYPVVVNMVRLPENIKKLPFTSPYENFGGLLYPTIIVLFIYAISNKRKIKWGWGGFPLIFLTIGLVYSFLTRLNCSYTASLICLLLFCQILIIIYVSKTCLTEELFLKAVYDGFSIIIVVEFIISFSYVFGDINTLQGLFYSSADDTEAVLRVGASSKFAMGTTYQHNRLGGICAYLFVFFMSCWLFGYRKTKSFFLTVIALFVLVLSQSRSALIGGIVSTVYLYFIYLYKMGKLTWSRLVAYFLLSVFFVFIFFNIPIVNKMFFGSNVDRMAEARQFHYLMGWNVLEKNEFMGCGMNSNTHYMYYNLPNMGYSNWLYMHSIHNIHLVIAVELGAIGFLLWVYYILSRNIRFIKTPIRKMNNPIYWFTFIGMLTVMIIHGISDVVELHFQYLMMLFLFGVSYSISSKQIPYGSVKHKLIKINT